MPDQRTNISTNTDYKAKDRYTFAMSTKHFLLVDDHNLFRTGLSMILKQNALVHEIYEAGSIMEAKGFADHSIDLILLDIQMPGISGLEGIKLLNETFPLCPIIILSSSHSISTQEDAINRGAKAFIHKNAKAEEIFSTIEEVLTSSPNQPSDRRQAKRDDSPTLSPRQLEVLALLCEGKTNKLIARDLGLAENTVRVHVSSILETLEVSRRSEAILKAQKLGIIV